ncbi:hypothetical protein PL371_05165 [Tenacibaculum maritimum]|nr:hypothetical protein [Tenacibaculum maritimum]MDB0611271.1 hypothetical protein [Tenacibaculum maritimum]
MSLVSSKEIITIQSAMSSRKLSRDERLCFLSNFFSREISSTKELTSPEAKEILYFLNTGKANKDNWGRFEKSNPKHRVILSQLYTLDWVKEHPVHDEVPDTEKLSSFLKSPKSPVCKPLSEMTAKELEKIISALNGIIKSDFS